MLALSQLKRLPCSQLFNRCEIVYIIQASQICNTKSNACQKDEELKISGLAKALGKFRQLDKIEEKPEEQASFLNLLRYSEFFQMGDPKGKIVMGKIFQVVNTDLYIDFGGKFYCVCRKPKRNPEKYIRNAKVRIRLNEPELSARFLGATKDLTLTEASGTLLDLVWTPFNKDGLKS